MCFFFVCVHRMECNIKHLILYFILNGEKKMKIYEKITARVSLLVDQVIKSVAKISSYAHGMLVNGQLYVTKNFFISFVGIGGVISFFFVLHILTAPTFPNFFVCGSIDVAIKVFCLIT